jgi:CBS domain-containing protein
MMTSAVVSVAPDTPAREVAKLLLDHGISAVPVVDGAGAPIGMVSEGDLIGRDPTDRQARRDWWLTLFAEGETLHPEFLTTMRQSERRAADVMTAPVVTVGENTEIAEIAKLLSAYRIKRVPVIHDGRIVGIVSRADLVRALASEGLEAEPRESGGVLAEAIAGLDHRFWHRPTPTPQPAPAAPPADDQSLTVSDFCSLVADHEGAQAKHASALERDAAEQRRQRIGELTDTHVSDAGWRDRMHRARSAAEQGDKEFLLLRFPSQICSDGGRAVNIAEADWPATLRGEAAELHLRWERDLKPRGFLLAARVLDFPAGMPGDIGLFLVWAR